jgi:hypothetical protein
MTASTDAQAAARATPPQRVPDFFIVGHAKSGTTALYEMLRRHPQIYMPDLKEPWFFAGDLRLRSRPSSSNPLPRTLEEYLSLFTAASPEQRIGEATPSYLMSATAAGSIAEVNPDARIVAILREPASFLRSLHLQRVKNHTETEPDLRRALALEPLRREGKALPRDAVRPQDLLYSEHVRYVEQLSRYHAAFSPEQVLVLIYEDFRDDNEATVRQVLRFLQADDTLPVEQLDANPTVGVRSQRLYELMRSVYLGRGPASHFAKTAIKALTPRQLRLDALEATRRRLYRKPSAPDASLTLELRGRFKGEVLALSDYLGRDLVTLWGYDEIG